MNGSQDGSGINTEVSEFALIIDPQDGSDPPVVVGGHAVNLWCDYYLSKGVVELSMYVPFTSKDLDLLGSAGLLGRLHRSHQGKLTRSEPRSPVLGRLDIARKGGGTLRIDVLHMVKGLNRKDLARTMELKLEGLTALVLLPHLILKAKIENSIDLLQDDRNDVKHVRMMILCMKAFIMEFVGFVSSDKVSERALVNVLGETWEIVNSSQSVKASKLWGFDFSAVWPMEELIKAGDGKIARWLEHRFPESSGES